MSDSVSNAILFAVYIFTVVPFIGAIFGGNHSSYGHNDSYENCIGRGFLVHFIIVCFYFVVIAIYHKIT